MTGDRSLYVTDANGSVVLLKQVGWVDQSGQFFFTTDSKRTLPEDRPVYVAEYEPTEMRSDVPAGSVWRERRTRYALRTVRVLEITDTPNPYVITQTITTTNGKAPKNQVKSAVRLDIWHNSFVELESCEDLCMEQCIGACGVGGLSD